MSRFDVVIVGAGPAGSSAGYLLAREGLRVALLDKETFPRDKACGDGLTVRALRELEGMGLGKWVAGFAPRGPVKVHLESPGGRVFEVDEAMGRGAREASIRFVPRRELDEKLVDHATRQGAQLYEGHRAVSVSYDGGRILVHCTCGSSEAIFAAEVAVVADGAVGGFGRAVGFHRRNPSGVAIRGYYVGRDAHPEFIDLLWERYTLPYYGWIFPVGGTMCNVGLGVLIEHARRARIGLCLQRFLKENARARARLADMELVSRPKVGCLRRSTDVSCVLSDRLLAVGDAAGLASPLTGEGISSALRSGYLAAGQIQRAFSVGDFSAGQLRGYARSLRREFGARFAMERLVCRLHRRAGVVDRGVALARRDVEIRRRVTDIMTGRARYTALLSPGALGKVLWGFLVAKDSAE